MPDTPQRSRVLLSAVLALSVGRPVMAAGQATDSARVTRLAPITVTGTREQTVAPPVSTVEVAPEEQQRTPAASPYDLLRRAAGIEVHEQGQGPGFASDAVLRGFTSDHSSDVLLVVDGVPINLPIHGHVEGYADWSILSPAAVSALRVIHGPASPLYGDFAFGGVVEVFTAADATGRAAALDGSSFGDLGGWIKTGRRSETGGMLLAVDGKREQGWRDNADYWLGNAVLRGWRQAGVGRVEGGLMLYGSTWDSPGFVSVARYNADDLEAATDPTDGGSAGRIILHGRYSRPIGAATTFDAGAWSQGVRSRVFLNIPEDGVAEQTEEEDKRIAVGAQARVGWNTGAGELSAGLSGRADWTDYDLYDTESRVRGSEEQANDGHYQAGGAFVRWRGLLAQRLVYDLGGRLDLLRYASLDRLNRVEGWRDETQVLASPKIGARYLLGSKVALLGSLSRGFRGAVGVIGDPSRPPVIGWSKEIGAAYEDERLHAQLALFQINVSNERIQDPVTRDVSDAGRSVRRGASLDLSFALTTGVHLVAEGTFNDAKITGIAASASPIAATEVASTPFEGPLRPSFHDVPLTPGARVPGVARYFGRAGVEAEVSRSIASRVLFRFSGPFTPIGEPSVRTKAYGIVDLGASLRLSRLGGVLDLDLLNLLDTRYPELRASGFLNPGAPRGLRAAVRFGGQS
jgi:outer membrane receptor for Fe3+-dicitrate